MKTVLIARPDLTRLFGAAIRRCGREAHEIDGETAFLAGARHLAELVQ
jgi:2-dehydro-3-deoxygalactonokinase